jgi:non-heme chloroperoxidase
VEEKRVLLPDGTGLTVREEGRSDAPALVFIHGVMMSGRFFEHQLTAFPGWRVVIPDLRGHGNSDKPLYGHTVANYARDLHALFDILDITRPVLVGWSMGAMVLWEYLRQFGNDSVRGVVIVDQPPSDFGWPDWEFGALPIEGLRDMVEALETDRLPVLMEFRELMVHDPAHAYDWMLEEMQKIPPAIAAAILCNQTFQDYRPLLPTLEVPALVAFGGDDKLTSPRAGQYIVDHMPAARLEVFSHSSHMPFLEEPEQFNQALHGFIGNLLA